MKRITFLSSLLLFVLFTACKPTQNEAIKYNDSIMTIVDGLIVDHSLLFEQIDGHNFDSLKITQKLFTEKAKASLDSCKKITPFAEDKNYLNAALDYFTVLNSLANNEGKQMVDIMLKDTINVRQEDLDKINELATNFDEKYGKVYDNILAAQTKFAKDWNFKLAEAEK
jgi:hypothetical protein